MNFTVSTIAASLADYLAAVLPGVTMYEDVPVQRRFQRRDGASAHL